MVVMYNPEVQGDTLTEQEVQFLTNLQPNCTTFSDDDPELTEELVRRMRSSGSISQFHTPADILSN